MDIQNKAALLQLMEIAFENSEDDDDECLNFIIHSSSSSDEDEEETMVNLHTILVLSKKRKLNKRPRIEGFVERIIPRYTAEEFKTHFRLLPTTFDFILRLIGPDLNSTKTFAGRKPIPAQKQLLMALWMMATPDSYRSACTKFDMGKATAIRAMRRVTYALHSLAPRFIQWPQGERATEVMAAFKRVNAFPGVIGAIDGTHVEIRSPQDDNHQAYINRKGYPSVHVQAVCTQQLLFTSVFVGNAGSVHDARVFRISPVARYIENPEIYFLNDSHLVGDAAYGIHPNMMVPYKDNGHLSPRQNNFNFCLSSARIAIERAFGVWKGRWRSILDCLPMIILEKIPEYIVATLVLHNICILNGDLIDNPIPNQHDIQRGRLIPGRVNDGNVKRQRIMMDLVMRN
ncbi:unnamed protein product [Lasius platythorax]|uniref:DDE Tnp4 domain-containing protein n=1 Tax=Lasius platythorax TaxID=488582 RepID=A0AAV2MXP8_9HYME